jgi:tetratricopeptide (TPR) repeat protein
MPGLSLCMIVKNEADVIERCLSSAGDVADEIIVVDTGSVDETPRIAERFGAQVYCFPWKENFSDARNYSLELASGNWILLLDADEELAVASKDILKQVIKDPQFEGYFFKLLNYVTVANWTETDPGMVFRLFRNRKEYRFKGAIHEQIINSITLKNPLAKLSVREDLIILHYGYLKNNVSQQDKRKKYLDILNQELTKDPLDRLLHFQYGEELFHAARYAEAIHELAKAGEGLGPHVHFMPKLLRMIIVSYLMLHQTEAAVKILQTSIGLLPNYADLYYLGGLLSIEKNEFSQAADFFQIALELPKQPAFYSSVDGVQGFKTFNELGKIAETFLNTGEALAQYTKSFQDNPDFTPALERILYLLKPRQNSAEARSYLKRISDFNAPSAALKLGQLLYLGSAYKLALEYLEKGTDSQEAPADIQVWKAVCLFQQRRDKEAIAILENFSPESPQFLMATFHLLICAWLQRNLPKVASLSEFLCTKNLSPDTQKILIILYNSLKKPALRSRPENLTPGGISSLHLDTEGIAIFGYILLRALDLHEKELADLLINELEAGQLINIAASIAEWYQNSGYLDSAEYFLGLSLKSSSNPVNSYYQLAEVKMQKGDLVAAVNFYRIALAHTADRNLQKSPRYYLALSHCYERLGWQIIQDALSRFRNNPLLIQAAREFNERTKSNFKTASNSKPQTKPGHYLDEIYDQIHDNALNNTLTLKAQKSKHGCSLQLLRRMAKHDPQSKLLDYWIGLEWFALGRFKQALPYLQSAINLDNSQTLLRTTAIRHLIWCYKALNQEFEALDVCIKESVCYSNYSDVYYEGGLIFEAKKEYPLAIKWFNKAIKRGIFSACYYHIAGTDDFLAFHHLGHCYKKQKQFSEAEHYYLQALNSNPKFIKPLYGLFQCKLAEGGPQNAFIYFKESTLLQTSEHILLLAHLFADRGYYSLANELLNILMPNSAPSNYEIEKKRAKYQIYTGNPATVRKTLEQLRCIDFEFDLDMAIDEIVMLILQKNFGTAREKVLLLWSQTQGRDMALALLNVISLAERNKLSLRPEKGREPAVIEFILNIIKRCLTFIPVFPESETVNLQFTMELTSLGITALTSISPESASALAAYFKEKAATVRKMMQSTFH